MGWPDPVQTLPAAMAALSRAEVNAAIQRHIDPANLDIVVVTADGSAFSEAIRDEAPTPIRYTSSPPAEGSDQAVEDTRISEIKVGLEGVEIVPTKDLFR